MEGYRFPPQDPNSISQGNNNSAASTADKALKAAPGVGLRNFMTWIAITNISGTLTRVVVKSGSTEIATFPAPAEAGCVFSLPTPLVCAENEALNYATADSVSTVYVSAGVCHGPKA